jgi:hypothetical protein
MPSSPQDQVGAIFSHRQIKFYLLKVPYLMKKLRIIRTDKAESLPGILLKIDLQIISSFQQYSPLAC